MQESSTVRRRAFSLSWLAYASYYLGRKGLSVTKATLVAQVGVGLPLLALLDTVYLATYAVGQVPSGLLADRIGSRRMLTLGMLLSAAALFVFGSAGAPAVFLACFALNGLAQATGWPGCAQVMAAHTTVLERARVMGWWSTCYQVGGIAATACATWLLAHYGWRAAFRVPAVGLAVVAGLVFLGLPDRSAAQASGQSATPLSRAELRALFSNPLIYSYSACYFCLKLIRYSLLFWLPFYLHTAAGFGNVESGYLSTSFEIGGVLGSVGMGLSADRFGPTRAHACVVSLVLLAISLFVYAHLGHASAVWHFAVMALVGVLLFGPDALLSGVAAQDAGGPRAAGTAAGFVNGVGSFGALCQGAVTVAIEQVFGWNAVFYTLLGLALLGAACLIPGLQLTRANVGGTRP